MNQNNQNYLKGSVQKNDYRESSPAEILYRDEAIQKEIKAQQQKRKNELLKILGPNATQGDILYGTEESLKKRAQELKLLPFSKDKDKHETLRQLSVYCYDNGRQELPKGYRRLEHLSGKNNGFDAVTVANDDKKEAVIAYRGMEPLAEVPSALRAGAANYTSQQKDAQAAYDKIKQDPKYKDYDIYTTGQSLGGYLAQYVAGKNDLKSATFNTHKGTKNALDKEANKNFQNFEIYPENIVNYRNKEDRLTKKSHNNAIGLSLETDAKINRKAGIFEKYHIAENMGSLENARLKNENYSTHTNAKGKPNDRINAKIKNFIHDKLNRKQNSDW